MELNKIEKQLKITQLPEVLVKSHKSRLRRALLNMEEKSVKHKLFINFKIMKKTFFIGTPLFTLIIAAIYILTIIFAPSVLSGEKVMAEAIKANETNQQQGDFRYMKYAITTYFDGKSKDFLYEIVDQKDRSYALTKELDPATGKILKSIKFDNRVKAGELEARAVDRLANCDLQRDKIVTLKNGTKDCVPIIYDQCDIEVYQDSTVDVIECKIAEAKMAKQSFININRRSNALCYLLNDRYFIIYGDTSNMSFITKHTEKNGVESESSEDQNANLLIKNGYKEINNADYLKLCQEPEVIDPEMQYEQAIKELKTNPAEFGIGDGAVRKVVFRGNYYIQISPIISTGFDVPKLIDAKQSTGFIDQYIQENGFRKVSIEDYVRGAGTDAFIGIDPAQPTDPNNQIDPANLFSQLKLNKEVTYQGEKTLDGKHVYVLSVNLKLAKGDIYTEAAFDKSTFELYKVDEYKMNDGQKQLELSYKIVSLYYSNIEPVEPIDNTTSPGYVMNGKRYN